jgi:hypothetical protein
MVGGEIVLRAHAAWEKSYYISRWYCKRRKQIREKRQYNKASRLGLVLRRLKQTRAEIKSIRLDEIENTCRIEYVGR